ncbi:MFS transporter [Parasphingorhabdus sp.]|uniref:MFS transporter n=1 Tax=Parasphingorhabdus sp. TaxID=2709688 RepID=UPI002B273370|nr:MFS transporter [Parasphingorhabdus sp.]|tara:strand:+ start:258 stop:1430 length:1173 start_codon:yes stop_codon:yes gene_type:complete
MIETQDSARRWPTAPPDGVLAGVMLSFLATAGLFYVNIMAAIVDGLKNGLGFTDSQAGNVAAANIYGAALGALVAIFLIKRVSWRYVAFGLLLTLIAIDLASMVIISPVAMIGVRLLHGIAGGLLVGLSYGVIARVKNPDRTFGILLFVQFGLGGLGVMTLPRLVPIYGASVLFIALILFSLATLMMLPFLDRYPANQPRDKTMAGPVHWKPLLLTLGAIFLFQAANMGLLAYIIGLGIDYGLERDYVSTALGLATWVALAGPLVVIFMGVRFGRFWPLAIVMLLTLLGTAAFLWSANPVMYLLANCGTGITWGMVMAYLLGMAARFDKAGRTAAAAGFVSKVGLASGPLVVGQMLAAGFSYADMLYAVFALLVLSMVVMLFPAAILDRK